MKKYMWILIIIATIMVIIFLGIVLSYFLNQPRPVATKTFSEIPGFSFQYPEFKGWKTGIPVKVNDNEYVILISYPENIDFITQPQMRIKKIPIDSLPREGYGIRAESVDFYASLYTIKIYPFIYEGDGYSGKAVIDKIIETFKFDK